MTRELITQNNTQVIELSGAENLLERIRPQWQSKSLIERVYRLLPVDPSSACQRLLNAAIFDLREKIIIAGLDIAEEAAKQNRLPPVNSKEDVSNYSTARLIDLAYHIGLLSRPEWRRVCRCYDIRKDLEHEDDQYEAGEEDCLYIFKTSIEVILAVDPVHLLKVTDLKELVEQPSSAVPDEELISDFERAPQPRQEEIMKFLLSTVLDTNQTDIVQQNAYICVSYFQLKMHNNTRAEIGRYMQETIGRNAITERYARVACVAGIFIYLRQSARKVFFDSFIDKMYQIGYNWSSYEHHGDLLRNFREYGAFEYCSEEQRSKILKWLVLCYIGTPGGITRYGNMRPVYYSNTAVPIIKELISEQASLIGNELKDIKNDEVIQEAIENQHVARRYETLVDLIDESCL